MARPALRKQGLRLGKGGKRGRREDALGTAGVERVSAQGCPHCAGREIVGWGRSDGLLRFRCKSCGRTFNALTRTPMAHLRKKEKWLDHARAMIEGKSLEGVARVEVQALRIAQAGRIDLAVRAVLIHADDAAHADFLEEFDLIFWSAHYKVGRAGCRACCQARRGIRARYG